MLVKLKKNQLDRQPEQLLRELGYNFIIDYKTQKESFARPLARGQYPRLHIYIEKNKEEIVLNLHMDQKKASYPGARSHNAEYGGLVVEQEAARIKQIINNFQINKIDQSERGATKVRGGNYKQDAASATKKRSWWQRIFIND